MSHIAGHWLGVATYAKGEEYPDELLRFSGPQADPTPPPLDESLGLLADAKQSLDWIATADDTLLSTTREELRLSASHGNVGTALMRVTLHTWYEIGEVNAVRQMLGHAPISFVGPMIGKLEWRSQ